ncbi:MAG: YihY/virulence factor BrkB family protein [Bacteroidales bacterium]|nr:YihY/virulence factor BrkB family protein [Bacteroidales bacterium]
MQIKFQYPKIVTKFILKFKILWEKIISISKYLILPGFEGMTLYDVASFFFKGIQKSSIIIRANSLSYTFLMSIFPAILFFFTLIAYIPIDNLHKTIMETLQQAFPENAYLTIKNTIEDILKHQNSGLLSVGFLLTIYFSYNGMIGLIKAFNQTSHTIESRSAFKLHLTSISLIFIVTIIIISSISLLIFTSYAIKYFVTEGILTNDLTIYLYSAGKWVIIFIMVLSMISIIYYLAPAKERYFKFISAGSTLATVLSLVFIFGFKYYIEHFSRYNKLYGSIGTLIVLMLWINLNALVLLIGYELNASIHDAKIQKKTGKE